MSPCASRAPRSPGLSRQPAPSWTERDDPSPPLDEEPLCVPAAAAPAERDTEPLSDDELVRLAGHFLERTELLIDVVAPPAWEDEDDLFEGEVFDDERVEYLKLASVNPSAAQKESVVRQLMANEALRYPGCSGDVLVAVALTYRRILLDPKADPRDKVEILRRVYSRHEPEWMTAEIVYLHFVLLDQCRYLRRASASLERKEETLRWIFTDPELEDRPFSFKNCVRFVTGNPPDLGAVYRRLKQALQPALAEWLRESLTRKRSITGSQAELFDV